jgi:PadR family transcriptional regulator PadR
MKNPQQRDLLPGALEMMILQTRKRQHLHGHALAPIKSRFDDLLQIEEVALYPALQRLLRGSVGQGRVARVLDERRVRIYRRTPAGNQYLGREVSRFEKMLRGITRVLAPGES